MWNTKKQMKHVYQISSTKMASYESLAYLPLVEFFTSISECLFYGDLVYKSKIIAGEHSLNDQLKR